MADLLIKLWLKKSHLTHTLAFYQWRGQQNDLISERSELKQLFNEHREFMINKYKQLDKIHKVYVKEEAQKRLATI